jgi:hypothetical protein
LNSVVAIPVAVVVEDADPIPVAAANVYISTRFLLGLTVGIIF